MKRRENAMGNPHRNFICVIERKIKGKWKTTWNAHLTYNIAEQMMQAFRKDSKYPENFRITRYVSEKPYGE